MALYKALLAGQLADMQSDHIELPVGSCISLHAQKELKALYDANLAERLSDIDKAQGQCG